MIPKQSFPKQCLTRLLAWLWSSPQLRGAGGWGWGPRSSENGSQDLTGIRAPGGKGSHHHPQLQPSIHTSWLDGDPLGRDGSFPSPWQLGTLKPTPKVH